MTVLPVRVSEGTDVARRSSAASQTSNVIEPLTITVLAGGPGAEREVSLESGKAVHAALTRLGHRCILRDIQPSDLSALDEPADFVFIALHGEFGEDGEVQQILDARKLSYSGSGSAASRLAINKIDSKRCAEQHGIPTPEWKRIDAGNAAEISNTFDLPAVVKPVESGSSVDLVIAKDRETFCRACAATVDRYGEALVERYVKGRELTVGIIGDRALPVCEIRTRREFYNYDAKYNDDDTEYLFDFELPTELLKRVQALSLDVHRAIGCSVLSRVDWMIDESSEPFLLEINTIPGFTSHSLVPKAAARIGIDFDALCQRIVVLSMSGSS